MSPDATTVDITSHDTYVEGVPHEVFAEMRAHRAGRLDRGGRRGPGLLEPHQVRRRPLRQSPHGTVLESPRHPHGGHGRRGDRGPSHHDGDGLARTHAPPPDRGPPLHAARGRRLRGRRARTGPRGPGEPRTARRSSTSSRTSRANSR